MMLYNTESCTLIEGDCLDVLRKFDADRFDSIVCDPPYELGFMGKHWDGTGIVYKVELWREVLRVLKPGGHLLAFGGTRTYHRMTCAIEDAGFEIRDSLHWMYGTGFPKSKTANSGMPEGQGTALKPGHEPIVMARKPLIGTIAANLAAHGTGGLNIDGCRLQSDDAQSTARKNSGGKGNGGVFGESVKYDSESSPLGRWPANVLLDEHAAAELDAQSGERKAGVAVRKNLTVSHFGGESKPLENMGYGGEGGASRFFYVAKPSRKERDLGCEHLPAKTGGEATDREDDSIGTQNPRAGAGRTGGAKNYHPTVKPIELMRYLVRLVTPPGGTVLDPFTGSGTTGCAAVLEGCRFMGVERESEYFEIAKSRISACLQGEAVNDTTPERKAK